MPDLPARAFDPEPGSVSALRCHLTDLPDGGVCVALVGELDIATLSQLDCALRLAATGAAEDPVVVVDLRALGFMGADGAHLLRAAARRLEREGGRLTLVRGSAPVDRLCRLVALERHVEIVDDVAAPPLELAGGARPPRS